MLRKILFIVFVSLFAGCSSEIINMDTARDQVRNYYESGAYAGEMEEIINNTMSELANKEFSDKSAAIFDVDDTVLSSYQYTSSIGFGFSFPTWKDWMHEERLTAIPQVKKIYDWLVQKKVNIIFLTGRPTDEYKATYNNLIKEGYTTFDTLICRPVNESKIDAAEYKPAQRKTLTEKGYDIIACFGDQKSDLAGDFTGIKVKLPNYLYLID